MSNVYRKSKDPQTAEHAIRWAVETKKILQTLTEKLCEKPPHPAKVSMAAPAQDRWCKFLNRAAVDLSDIIEFARDDYFELTGWRIDIDPVKGIVKTLPGHKGRTAQKEATP